MARPDAFHLGRGDGDATHPRRSGAGSRDSKRGGAQQQVSLDVDALAASNQPAVLIEIDAALDELAAVAPRLAQIVVFRFYGGLTDQEIADALDVTPRTVQRDWLKARMLLNRALAP